ncbi:MAG: 4Fe-4S dicluster domain-containing protein [Dehalococcoidales bacterium]|nr:4Fe-4S dicluster domain-containing protein [Dehalococcoidales bacterium]
MLGLSAAGLPDNEAAAEAVLRAAIEQGVNYIDLGSYDDILREEEECYLVGRVISEMPSRHAYLTVSLPSDCYQSGYDLPRFLGERLSWLGVGTIDALNFSGLNRDTWPLLQESGILAQAEEAVTEAYIAAIGFSFHDQVLYLRPVLNGYDNWSFCSFPYSFMDADRLPGTSGLTYAAQKGLAVVAMEPLLGGRLAARFPEPVAGLWGQASPRRSPAEWALRWAWNQSRISTAVVNLKTPEQVAECTAWADLVEPDSLSVPEEVLISRVRDAYRKLRPVPCTTCRACMPCPRGIDAPRIFELYNDAVMYGNADIPRSLYRWERHSIGECDECGACARACGRSIDIPERLREAHRFLAGD